MPIKPFILLAIPAVRYNYLTTLSHLQRAPLLLLGAISVAAAASDPGVFDDYFDDQIRVTSHKSNNFSEKLKDND